MCWETVEDDSDSANSINTRSRLRGGRALRTSGSRLSHKQRVSCVARCSERSVGVGRLSRSWALPLAGAMHYQNGSRNNLLIYNVTRANKDWVTTRDAR